jgi:hypothetical protein
MKLYYCKICIIQTCISLDKLVLSVTRLLVTVNLIRSACSFAEHYSEVISTPIFGGPGFKYLPEN